MKKLQDEKYTMDDAKKGRDIRGYAAMVMRHAKATEMDRPHQQLSHVYNNLDPELRPHISAPDEKTIASELLKSLANKQEAWQDMIVARRPRDASTRPTPRFDTRGTNSRYPRNGDRQGTTSGFRPYQPRPNITPQSPVKAMQPSLEGLLSREPSHLTAQLYFLANLPLLGSARGSSLQICICPLMLGSLQSKYP
ncbi:hypothetical protein F5882DRAFT_128196 [Hyaloscypha sp. PMI_1271]|nr:hypothetical protein F5882DRAFT_128196 [Hyaloscypha sp. PMI_1271]